MVHHQIALPLSRGRYPINEPGRSCVKWLSVPGARKAVAQLGEPGRVIVRAWGPLGDLITARLEELSGSLDDVEVQLRAMALATLFAPITIEADPRLVLRDRELIHLGIVPKSERAQKGRPVVPPPLSPLVLQAYPDRFELLSVDGFVAEQPRLIEAIDEDIADMLG